MVLSAYHAQVLPPSGAAHAIALHLTPSPNDEASTSSSRTSPYYSHSRGHLVCHLVTARDDVVDVYEVRRKDGSAAGAAGAAGIAGPSTQRSQTSLHHVRSHGIFGKVTGLARCKVSEAKSQDASPASSNDTRNSDTLVVSFADAKMALMQWSDAAADLVSVSIHTYERAEQLAEGLPSHFLPALRADPESRCVALLLPHDALAILPFYNDTAEELDQLLEQAGSLQGNLSLERSLPYAPSFLLDMQHADSSIKNIRDFVFLPNFQRPTVAVLFEREATWTGRLNERNDTCSIRIVTLDLTISTNAQHRVISSRDSLPFNCLYLTACPSSMGGGVLITTPAALLYMDQNGRTVGLAVSGWHALTSKISLPSWKGSSHSNGVARGHANGSFHASESNDLDLSGSQIVFPHSSVPQAFVLQEDGTSWLLTCALEGRSVSSIDIKTREKTAVPSLVVKLPGDESIFVGSMTGQSQLYEVLYVESMESTAGRAGVEESIEGDMDLDEDLYGEASLSNGKGGKGEADAKSKRGEMHLRLVHEISSLGPILHVCPTVVADSSSIGGLAQTVICSGGGQHGGLNLLEPQIMPRQRKQLALAASENVFLLEADNKQRKMLLASSAEMSDLAVVDESGLVQKTKTIKGRTVFAKSMPSSNSNSTILRVTSREVEVLDKEGSLLKTSVMGDDRPSDIDIIKAELTAGYLVLLWTDGTLDLIVVSDGNIEHIELPDALQSLKYISAGVLEDRHQTLRKISKAGAAGMTKSAQSTEKVANEPAKASRSYREEDDEEVDYGETDLLDGQSVQDMTQDLSSSPNHRQGSTRRDSSLWLVLTTSEACVQIYEMQSLDKCLWQSNSLYPAPSRLDYVATVEEDADVPSLELSDAQVSYIGDVLHLTVAYENGLLNVFEAVPFPGEDEDVKKAYLAAEGVVLALSFTKVIARELDVSDTNILSTGATQGSISLSLTPFKSLRGHAGVFIGGASPAWLFRDKHGLTHLYMSSEAPMASFDAQDDTEGNGSTFAYSQYGIACIAELPNLDYTLPVPHQKKARTGRTYTKAAPHPFTKTIVAASVLPHEFVLFDPEDGHIVEDPSRDPSPAYSLRGAIELFAEGEGEPIDGFEFDQCEIINCVELVTLRSRTSASGLKDFVAVGTIFSHGEDRPARGATYIFDIIEVVAPPGDPGNCFKLRLLVKDDAKGPITAITDMNGYLVTVMGLKLFVRSLEKDEWLITIAFLDTPFLVNNIQRLKNFLLLSDVKRSVLFVAFQEEPYRLVVVSKDYNLLHATTSAFLLKDGDMTIAVTSDDGVLRLFDYAPNVPASQGGPRLLVRSEFETGAEASCVMVMPGPASRDGGISTSSELVYAMVNGAMQTLQPVEEEIFNTLNLLQGQLVRNVQHFAGLNPRGYRAVRNELTTRPLTKGILDGRLLANFEMLPRPKMEELAKLVPDLVDGSDQLLRYLATLRSSWGVQ